MLIIFLFLFCVCWGGGGGGGRGKLFFWLLMFIQATKERYIFFMPALGGCLDSSVLASCLPFVNSGYLIAFLILI
jgi:hypothetical protein